MGALVLAELRKVSTTRLWWGLMIAVVLLAGILAVVTAVFSGVDLGDGQSSPGVDDPAVVRGIYTAGLTLCVLFTLSLGILSMTTEYRHQTITATLLADPGRRRVVLAKIVSVLAWGGLFGVVTVATGVVAGGIVIAIRGGDLRLTSDDVPRTLALSVLALALWGLLGLGVGVLIKNQVVALLVAVGFGIMLDPIASAILNASGNGEIARWLPTQATTALTQPVTDGGGGLTFELLPWWGGALVLLAYAVAFGALGAAVTLRRDVT